MASTLTLSKSAPSALSRAVASDPEIVPRAGVDADGRPRNWRAKVRAEARWKAKLAAQGVPHPARVAQLRRKREIEQGMKRARGEPTPNSQLRHGRRPGPGEYNTSKGVRVKDPNRRGAAFRSHTVPEYRGIPYNKDVALVYHTPSLLAEHTSKVPPNAYDLSGLEIKQEVNKSIEDSGGSSNFDSECLRFDENSFRTNFRYSTAQENPSPRFSMRQEERVWHGSHPLAKDIRGPVMPKEKRPDLWNSGGEGADKFYRPRPSLAQELKLRAQHRHVKQPDGVNYDVNNSPRFPESVVRQRLLLGPADYNPVQASVDIKEPERLHSMFRSDSTRQPLFCQHPYLLTRAGY